MGSVKGVVVPDGANWGKIEPGLLASEATSKAAILGSMPFLVICSCRRCLTNVAVAIETLSFALEFSIDGDV
jgi:hypothetical protein